MTSDAPSRVLLIGPPNVGKSVLFNRLTGLHVYVANYAGATVGYHLGQVPLPGKTVTLVDVPGIYTLSANNAAEQLAIDLLSGQSVRPSRSHCGSPRCQSTHCAANQATATDSEQDASVAVSAAPAPTTHPAAIVFVLDACNLESSLFLLLQVLAHQRPTVVVVNRMDLAEERGLSLDLNRLSQALGINVLPCVAKTGKGIEAIRSALALVVDAPTAAMQPTATQPSTSAALWVKAENLAQLTQGSQHRSRPRTTRQLWGERLVKPWPGMALALVVMAVAFGLIVGLGMGLRKYVLLPVIREHIIPGLSVAVEWVTAPGMLRNVLIGDYGLLVKGLEWPFALVLPYVISFYLTLGLLEDSGYLARLGSLLDGLLSRIGLPGTGAIPLWS